MLSRKDIWIVWNFKDNLRVFAGFYDRLVRLGLPLKCNTIQMKSLKAQHSWLKSKHQKQSWFKHWIWFNVYLKCQVFLHQSVKSHSVFVCQCVTNQFILEWQPIRKQYFEIWFLFANWHRKIWLITSADANFQRSHICFGKTW